MQEMASNIVVDEMFPEGSGSFMDVDEGHIGSVGGKEVGLNQWKGEVHCLN